MFAAKTKSMIKCLGAEKDLIYNDNLSERIEFLSLVKVSKKKSWPVIKYSFIDLTLFDLLTEENSQSLKQILEESEEGSLLENVSSSVELSGSATGTAAVDGGILGAPVTAEVSAEGSSESTASPFNLKYKIVNLNKLKKECNSKQIPINSKLLGNLEMSKNLAFVYKIVSNSTPVNLVNKISGSGSFSAKQKLAGKVSAKASGKEELRFTIPAGCTFAFGLMHFNIEKNNLSFPLVSRHLKRGNYGPENLKNHRRNNFTISSTEDTDDEVGSNAD